MKNIIFKAIVLCFTLSPFTVTAAADVVVYCNDESKNEIVKIDSDSDADAGSCVGDLIWGKKNVCFEGDPNALAELMNNKKFRWSSSGYSAVDASVTSEGAVDYTGVDSMSFFMEKRTVFPCAPGFIE